MKNIAKKLKSLLLILLCVVLIIPALSMNVSAATQKQKAMAAYKKWLSQNYVRVIPKGTVIFDDWSYTKSKYSSTKASQVKFTVAYINNDSVPELVVYTKQGHIQLFSVLTYKNGKIQRVYTSKGDSVFKGYFKKTGCFFVRSFTDGTPYYDRYCKMSGVKSSEQVRKFAYGYSNEADYFKGQQEISKSTYNSIVKKLRGGETITRVTFYKNTKANRDNKLK